MQLYHSAELTYFFLSGDRALVGRFSQSDILKFGDDAHEFILILNNYHRSNNEVDITTKCHQIWYNDASYLRKELRKIWHFSLQKCESRNFSFLFILLTRTPMFRIAMYLRYFHPLVFILMKLVDARSHLLDLGVHFAAVHRCLQWAQS